MIDSLNHLNFLVRLNSINFINRLNHLMSHSGFKKYFANTSWLFAEKILRMAVGLFVGIWVARYLGPEQFGILSYVGAFIGLFIPFSKLGFDGIIQRNIAKDERNVEELLNSSMFFKLIGSFLIVIITTTYMYFTKKDKIYFYIALILSFVYLIKSFEVIEFYFRAKVKAKYISISNSIAMLISAILKIIFILTKFSLIWFAFSNLVEAIIAGFLLYFYFLKERYKLSIKRIKIKIGIELLRESWPMFFSGFLALIYLNIDQVMIEEMLNSYEVGQYSAAVRISSAFYFIPITLGWSIQTAIVNAKKQNLKVYYERIQLLFTLSVIMSYIFILPISYFSSEIIVFLFGESYHLAGNVLELHIFASLFMFINVGRSVWILNEGYFKLDLFANIIAGILNIILNYFWIPEYGIYGAAWATLISYGFTYVLSNIFFKPARKIFIMQLKSIFLIDIFKQIKILKNQR